MRKRWKRSLILVSVSLWLSKSKSERLLNKQEMKDMLRKRQPTLEGPLSRARNLMLNS